MSVPSSNAAVDASARMSWGTQDLWEALRAELPDLSIEVMAQLESTNTVLVERARKRVGAAAASGGADIQVRRSVESRAFGRRSDPSGGRREFDEQACLLVAEHQSAGRGRNGNAWQSARGASLTFSLMLPYAPADWSGLSLAVGLALAEALDPLAPGAQPRIGLKWPNDLWLLDTPQAGAGCRGRKLGGILIETVASAQSRMVVVGVGLNVAALPEAELRQLPQPVAALQELHGGLTPPQVLARVALPLVRALRAFETQGWASFAGDFARRDVLTGQVVTTLPSAVAGEGAVEGVAQGVASDGGLRVLTRQGEVVVRSGEISVRLQAGPQTEG
jgi:BirA family biotin operon repressor/biotin-[acetyl-CoA-carboxylase] ligase